MTDLQHGIQGGIVEYAHPAEFLTYTVASGQTVTGGQLVELSGARTVRPSQAGSRAVVGVALHNAAAGEIVSVCRNGVWPVTASENLAAGDRIVAAAAGKAAKASTSPVDDELFAQSPALGTDVEGTTVVGRVPQAGVVTAVTFVAAAAITGAATNHRKVELVNKGQSGAGTDVIAELAFDNGVNATAFDEKTIVIDTAKDDVAAGDILAWASTAPGSGLADPGGGVRIKVTRTVGAAPTYEIGTALEAILQDAAGRILLSVI